MKKVDEKTNFIDEIGTFCTSEPQPSLAKITNISTQRQDFLSAIQVDLVINST
ncbi:MAG: hypothetical protein IKH14_00060 [Prevotella sp.]|nr:hypothetical protein [Prevotella sp.]